MSHFPGCKHSNVNGNFAYTHIQYILTYITIARVRVRVVRCVWCVCMCVHMRVLVYLLCVCVIVCALCVFYVRKTNSGSLIGIHLRLTASARQLYH